MALTLDGNTSLPMMGSGTGSGAALGLGGGVLGGGLAGLAGGLLSGALFGNRNNGGWGGNGYGGVAPVAGAVATDIVLNPSFQALQAQLTALTCQINNNQLLDTVTDNQIALMQGQNGIQNNLSSITRDIIAGQSGLATAQATSAFTTLQSINDLGRDVTAQSNQQALQQLNSFNNLTTTTLQGFNGAAMQTQNSTNQIIANQTAQAAIMAQCCCDIKQLIQSDGSLTRSLINDLNVQSLRDQLAAANGKVSNNEQNQYLLSTILTHLRPTTVPGVVV